MTMLNEGMSNKLETKNQLFMMFSYHVRKKKDNGLDRVLTSIYDSKLTKQPL